MRQRKAKAKPVDRARFNRDSLITRAEAVRLIAQTRRRADETDNDACDRVSQVFTYAAKTGKLPQPTSGSYVFGELAAWAQDKWPGMFADWPAIRTTGGALSSTLEGVTMQATGVLPPPDLQGCHQRIAALAEEVAALYRANAALQGEVVELRPYKVRYEEQCQENRESAKKLRPRTK